MGCGKRTEFLSIEVVPRSFSFVFYGKTGLFLLLWGHPEIRRANVNMRRIKVFDTTLRDGEQSPGCSMNLTEKLQMARQLDALGVDVIEAGFAIASPDDFKSVEAISQAVMHCKVASLARCTKGDIDAAWNAVKGAKYPRIHVFLATSDIHMEYKLKMTREQVLASIKEHVAYARAYCNDVEFSAEDASRSDRDFLARCCETAIKAGAMVINVPDTVGYSTPDEMFAMVTYLREHTPGIETVDISSHCHDDLGMAVANSLACLRAGATQVECTVNGIGERAGNASLEEIAMAIKTRGEYYQMETGIITQQIYKASKLLSNITGVPIAPSKSIVGARRSATRSRRKNSTKYLSTSRRLPTRKRASTTRTLKRLFSPSRKALRRPTSLSATSSRPARTQRTSPASRWRPRAKSGRKLPSALARSTRRLKPWTSSPAST